MDKLPHFDIAHGFSKIKSMYFINLSDCLRRIDPTRVTNLMWELEWDQQPRGLTEILKWMDRLTTMVWHNRHMNWVWRVENGKEKIVSREEWAAGFAKHGYKYNAKHTPIEVWQGALKDAQSARKRLGPGVDGYGPYTDFEWGMINGKLSALRWVLGDEWDIRGVVPFALQDIAKDGELPKDVFDAVVPPVDVDVPNMRDLKVWLTWYLAQWADEHLRAGRQH